MLPEFSWKFLGNATKFWVVTELLNKELDIGEIKPEVW